MTREPLIVFYQSRWFKQWRWKLVGANNEIICGPGESFSSKAKAENNLRVTQTLLPAAKVVA